MVLQVHKLLLLHIQCLLATIIIMIYLGIVEVLELWLVVLIDKVLRVKDLIIPNIHVSLLAFLDSLFVDLTLFLLEAGTQRHQDLRQVVSLGPLLRRVTPAGSMDTLSAIMGQVRLGCHQPKIRRYGLLDLFDTRL